VPLRAVARVNLAAIERNCARLAGEAGPTSALAAVVKADGYGHGAVPVARAAIAGGATWLAVATAGEAMELRAAAIGGRLLVMGAIDHEELELAVGAGAELVAWRRSFVERLEATGAPVAVHVKLDTGMGRLGTRDRAEALDVAAAVAASPALRLAGAMTHFATADEDDDAFFEEQLARFEPFAAQLAGEHPGLVVHAANSAATLRSSRARFDLVRCGIAVYGMDPFQRDPAEHGLEPALELRSYVADVKLAQTGDSAGYGRRFVAEHPTWLGVVPIGYGDGVRRALTNDAEVLVRGRRRPLVGTVSMDNVTIDLGPEPDVTPGDAVVLLGADGSERVLAEEWARRLGTINYEITCALTTRVPREYHRDGVPA
jgi:alanine racemase